VCVCGGGQSERKCSPCSLLYHDVCPAQNIPIIHLSLSSFETPLQIRQDIAIQQNNSANSHIITLFHYYHILSYSLFSICFINAYMVVLLFNTLIYVFFIVMSMYFYSMFMYLYRASWHSSATLIEVFPCFFLSCKANTRVFRAKMGHGPYTSKMFVLFFVLFVLCCCMYCLCVTVYCTTATEWLPNCI
jgi:hypothetical protein